MSVYVISHSGKKGGPWEACIGPFGHSTSMLSQAARGSCPESFTTALPAVRKRWPSAKVFRLVRRPSLTTLERAVVEAAMAWHEPFAEGAHVGLVDISPFETAMDEACAALRAKRGG